MQKGKVFSTRRSSQKSRATIFLKQRKLLKSILDTEGGCGWVEMVFS
jgi:hypothetical protein